jgi:hypothetical protein
MSRRRGPVLRLYLDARFFLTAPRESISRTLLQLSTVPSYLKYSSPSRFMPSGREAQGGVA